MQDVTTPIVVGIDGSAHSERALRWAVREAQLRNVTLTLVHGYVDDGVTSASTFAAEELARRLVHDVVARHRALLERLPDHDTVVIRASHAADALLDAGRHSQLIVVGTRGLGGFSELLLGSTSHRVLTHAAVPVALIRSTTSEPASTGEERDGRRPVVVGVDASPESETALRWAVDEACRRGVGMLAVHGLDLPDPATLRVLGLPVELVAARLAEARAAARDEIDALLHRAEPVGGDARMDRVIDDGAPVAALQRYATAEHLLVVGTRGRRGFAELGPGSVSHQCAHHAAGPMVAVPHHR
ncbi:MAG TPA: universal stress protein [Euzebyales bacterium]|nr:universal stress protein [Euzebyales bacterium]